MKKFLSLVLALVMTMSLVTIGAGASFTDDDDINYDAAVDVMAALEIIGGYADGSFKPTGTLTRGAASKIICGLILTPEVATTLKATTAPYTDVAVNSTYAGYIAFCQKEGIVSGYADGSFKPGAPLTNFAFLKMLLGALGYDQKVEGFTGSNWAINVAKMAKKLDLVKGDESFVGTAAATREEACLFAVNMLQAQTVTYPSQSTITIGDVEISQSGTATPGATFMAANYSDLTVNPNDKDAFGAPATTWTLAGYGDDGEIGSYNNAATLTYTTKVKAGDIYTALGKPAQSDIDTFAYYIDGKDDNGATLVKADIASGDSTEIGGNGAVTTVYYDKDTDELIVTTVNTYYGTISNYTAAVLDKNGDVTTKAYVKIAAASAASAKPGTLKNAGKINTTKFTKDDQYDATPVLYTAAWDTSSLNYAVKSVVKADNTATLTPTVSGSSSFTAGGTKYSYAAKVAAQVGSGDVTGKLSKTVYFDDYGYVIYVDNATAASNYAVVVAYKEITGMTDEASYYEARLLKFDGTTEVVKSKTAGVNTMVDKIVSYSENADDAAITNLSVPTGSAKVGATANVVTKNKPTIGASAATADNNTVFVVSETSGSKTTYKVFTGINNVPTISNCAGFAYYDTTDGDTVANYVYVKNAVYAGGSSTDVIYYYKDASNPTTSVDNGTYYEVKAIVNGEFVTLKSANVGLNFHFSGSMTTNNKDVITSTSNLAGGSGDTQKNTHYSQAVTSDAKNGIVGLGGVSYTYSADTAVYFWDVSDGEFTEASTADLVTGEGYTVDFYTTGDVDSAITMAVIAKA